MSMGVTDQIDSTPRTFTLGVVQATVAVSKNLTCLAYFNSLCRRPVEGDQAFAVQDYSGTSVTQSFNLYLRLAIGINGVDLSKVVLRFVSRGVVNCGCE